LPFVIGEESGLTSNSIISQENLKRILDGVSKGNRDSIYFYGLLKLYGLTLPKNENIAAENFKKAGNMGMPEALTAYGVMLMTGLGVERDASSAINYFRKAIKLNDINAHWLLGK
jgi:TPR repeat protein